MQKHLKLYSAIILLLLIAISLQTIAQDEKPPTQHAQTNALAKETSPYLLMHAHNPVNWHAWNEESLALAKKENKPIFLSIGYSSCHWCHVMERESFLDETIAKFLNEHFICIKVDREERPDVDEIYMEALLVFNQVSGSNRGGGWPLTMILLPDGRPFFGGTYFPAHNGDRPGSPGLDAILFKIIELFTTQQAALEKDAQLITDLTRQSLNGRAPISGAKIQRSWINEATMALLEQFDPQYGGFGFNPNKPLQPKFPEASNLMYLASQLSQHASDADTRRMFLTTCEGMMQGGIHDHLGGGFHRYSVDRYWRIPHYEKMLYDNGQLATIYAAAYEATGREEFRDVTTGILDFIHRELTAPEGGFYTSLDAESEGEEGKFYVWTAEEIKQALTSAEFELFAPIYGINERPNFEGKFYAPQLTESWETHAQRRHITITELQQRLTPIRKKLFEIRAKRVRPLTDKKILTSWNGLMIRGYADAGRILNNDDAVQTAARAADFALEKLVNADGRLLRTYTDGQAKLNAYLDDYTMLIDGLIALHRATGDSKWLAAADKLQQQQNQFFWDEKDGGYFFTSSDHEVLLARSKKPSDSAMPAGNSVAAGNLFYLGDELKKDEYKDMARRTVLSASSFLEQYPTAAPRLLNTALEFLGPDRPLKLDTK